MPATYVGGFSLRTMLAPLFAIMAEARGSLSILDGIYTGIRLSLIADLEAKLDATLSASVDIGLQPPGLYFEGLLSGILDVQANLELLTPQLAVDATLDVSADLELELDASLKLIAGLLTLKATIDGLLNVSADGPGIHLFSYDGSMNELGSSLDSVKSMAGIPGSTRIKGLAILLEATKADAAAQLSFVFGVTL